MGDFLKRYAVTMVTAILGLGFQLSDVKSNAAAYSLWSIAVAWAIVASVVWWRQRHPVPEPDPDPRTLPPPSRERLEQHVLDSFPNYQADSTWNAEEGRAYLMLHRKYQSSQGFRVIVRDQSGTRYEHRFAQGGGTTIVDRFPDEFRDAPGVSTPGTYYVTWEASVEQQDGALVEGRVAGSEFTVT